MNSDSTAVSIRSLDLSLLIVRVILGVIFIAHGAQKLFGAFGGQGMEGIVKMLGPVGYLVAIGEFFGGVGILLGFLTRFSAASIILIMCGAIAMVHGKNGFFMDKGGFEYNLALIGLAAPLVLLGPGCVALGRFLPLPRSKQTGRTVIGLE